MKNLLILIIAGCAIYITITLYRHTEAERKSRVEAENAADMAKLAERQNGAKALLGR